MKAKKIKSKTKLVVHAGVHKTGTTSIQHHLWQQRHTLIADGILYPRSGIPTSGTFYGHHEIPWLFTGRGPFRANALELLQEEIATSDAHTVILSSEEFDRLDPDAIRTLTDALPYRTSVIFYYRRQSDILEGMYRTDVVHTRERRSLQHHVASYDGALDFGALTEAWLAAPNVTEVKPRAYAPKRFPNGNVVVDFLEALSLPMAEGEGEGEDDFRYNQSLPWHAVASIQKLREVLISEQVVSKVTEAIKVVSRRSPPSRGKLMSPELAREIDAQYAQRNAAFHAKYCPDQPPIRPSAASDDVYRREHQGLWPDVERTLEWMADYILRTKR